ncbi:MAG: imidazole glycerol phosphate synthase subunit HisH [Lachnospiraceae bacterium]|nr:imidazole glycerol phosphate synthase subunit HisH [Lachnospiraceae bacterium]MBO7362630.1 imidazole glycerol phosphate synthase subunit HisH [Lachnospiraceae bacterium]
MIAVVDYDAGNVKSVEKALDKLGAKHVLTSDPEIIKNADSCILPGVGNFGDCMDKLRSRGLDSAIREFAASGKCFLGICVGLQLLFDESEESPGVQGLGILKGKVKKFESSEEIKVPQIGWNDVTSVKGRLFDGIGDGTFFYFVHSYYLDAEDKNIVTSKTSYGIDYDSSVESGNVFATQFHPEKSSDAGMKVLTNFLKIAGEI